MIWFADADMRPVGEAFQMLLFGMGLVLGLFTGWVVYRVWRGDR